MVRTLRDKRRAEALEKIYAILSDANTITELIMVEGVRDVKAIRELGYLGRIDVISHSKISFPDLATYISESANTVLVLTDFDESGMKQADRLTSLLEGMGVKVEKEKRRILEKLFNAAGTKTVESIDDILHNFEAKSNL
ncbi:MAG: toprim domain-containing protein [Candidatus Bathyarchaeota archaeon]|nr:toprim domain-containing protein [Candidatus Bathyarchaeota archaeon]